MTSDAVPVGKKVDIGASRVPTIERARTVESIHVSTPKIDLRSPTERVLTNHTVMSEFVARAEASMAGGRLEQSAVWLQIAATFGWFNHPGLFTHPQLEAQLVSLSEVVQARASRQAPKMLPSERARTDQRSVLHVATQLYPTGGHTQMIARWVAEDNQSRSSLILTRQGPGPIPAKISALFPTVESGLDWRYSGLLARAAQLRRAAESADVVVIHAHPDDVVPAIAFAASAVPCIVVNHADHVYWAGASAAKTVFHMRRSGQDLAERRRGLPAAQGLLLNRPLEPASLESRAAARTQWGLASDEVLLVTAAASSKYVPFDGTSLIDMLVAASSRNPKLRVLAAGPAPEGAWQLAAQQTQGAVRALGRVEGVASLFAAADIYVDSFPFSSLTSLLEAGSYGMPAVSFRGHPAECAVLGADSPVVDAAILYPDTEEKFLSTISELTADESRRRRIGRELQQKISDTHSRSWKADLEELYALAVSHREAPDFELLSSKPETGPLDIAVEQVQRRTGFGQGRGGAIIPSLGLLKMAERLSTFGSLRRDMQGPSVKDLLPPLWRTRLSRARQRRA